MVRYEMNVVKGISISYCYTELLNIDYSLSTLSENFEYPSKNV